MQFKNLPNLGIERLNPKGAIPQNTPYCYRHTGRLIEKNHVIENGKLVKSEPYKMPEMIVCPYWDWISDDAYCHYLKEDGGLLFDQVKECGVSEPVEEQDVFAILKMVDNDND